MNEPKKILALCGSTRKKSSNLQILQFIQQSFAAQLNIEIYTQLEFLPHFNPDRDGQDPPSAVVSFRKKINEADGVIICTPEYVFSLPGTLKNAIDWMVSTTLFSELPVALITASGLGQKAHESLIMIMKTIYAQTNPELQLLIQGARAKINTDGIICDPDTSQAIQKLMEEFIKVLDQRKN
ncbi:MAG: NADPH-dependent FMN reductase [Flavisolibacter sp.]